MDPEGRKYPKSELLVAEYIRQGRDETAGSKSTAKALFRQTLWRMNLPHRNTHYPLQALPLTFSPHHHHHRLPFIPNGSHGLLSSPARCTEQRAGLYVPLIPIEQSNLHRLYINRMKILIMSSDTRERYPSGEPRPPDPRSPCPYRVSATSPHEEAGDNIFYGLYTATHFLPKRKESSGD